LEDNDRFDIEYYLSKYHGMNSYHITIMDDSEIYDIIKILYPYLSASSTELEIYGTDENRKKIGWILSLPISSHSTYAENLIRVIITSIYEIHKSEFRTFSKHKAIYLIRWLGFESRNFLNNLALGNTDGARDSVALGRWRFLQKFWNSKHMSFFINYENSNEIISKDHSKYLIRLSTSYPGQLAIHYWNPNKQKVDAALLNIDLYGNILFMDKFNLSPMPNMELLDIQFHKLYHMLFNIELPSINGSDYDQIVDLYRYGY
jgi:hypothetical protein